MIEWFFQNTMEKFTENFISSRVAKEKLYKQKINLNGKFIYFSFAYANIEKMQTCS